jgi:two-component system sensor histidine kinase/response regulator
MQLRFSKRSQTRHFPPNALDPSNEAASPTLDIKVVLLEQNKHEQSAKPDGRFDEAIRLERPLNPRNVVSALESSSAGSGPQDRQSRQSKDQSEYSDKSALVVDDNATNRLIATKRLQRFGLEIATAASGCEALEQCNGKTFDIILMDCMMPEMDGYETTSKLRERADFDTPIIALTANAMQGDRDKCLASGMNDFLSKPLRPADLQTILDKWLEIEGDQNTSGDVEISSEAMRLLDITELEEMFEGSKEMIQSLLEEFESSLIETLEELKIAAADPQDLKVLRLHSHTIKGMAANFGAAPLISAAANVENACLSEDSEKALALAEQVVETSLRTLSEIRKLSG